MNFPGQFATGIATLISLGFLLLDYRFHHSHVTPAFLYFWMAIYFLYVMALMMCAHLAFQVATDRWPSLLRAGRRSHAIAAWVLSGLLTWFAFWRQHAFLWMVFALALLATLWLQFNEERYAPRLH